MFEQSGKFVTEKIIAPATLSSGSAFVPVLSKDPQQQWLYLADGTNHKIWMLRRSTMEVVGEFGRGGRQLGQFLRPHGMSIDSKGNLYVGEASTGPPRAALPGHPAEVGRRATCLDRAPPSPSSSCWPRAWPRRARAIRRRTAPWTPPARTVKMVRPAAGDPPLDDVNWFARPVPNAKGDWIVAVASHNLNYLYNLTTGVRVRIPDKSDAVATPDGRYVTVPSHYTAANTVSFYDAATLLERLAAGRDAADVKAAYEHRHADVHDVYYQSVGVLSQTTSGGRETTVYRMMFSGSTTPKMPGFRVVDYTFTRQDGRLTVTPTVPMRLCPQITRDLATPFISKDGRYVVAHDDSVPGRPASLKIFEITGTDPAAQSTSCEVRADFGFAAGKADFSFDGRQVTFHISKHDYLTPFVDGGLTGAGDHRRGRGRSGPRRPGTITGVGGVSRLTTSTTEGVGSYFPAFLPDGMLFYVANEVPKQSAEAKRFRLTVVDPSRQRRVTELFTSPARREAADAIGELWRQTCAPTLTPFRPQEAAWAFTSLAQRPVPPAGRGEVAARHRRTQGALLAACDAK